MNTYGYLRVSGKGQVDGDGPERQKDAITRFSHALGLGEPEFFYEAAVSGTVEAMDRPQFVAMLEAIARLRSVTPDSPVCIVVERQDRLARDLIVQELLLAECVNRKIPVYSTDRGTLTDLASTEDDPTRKVIRQILGAMAEWDKSVTVLKLRAARDRKRVRTGRCEGPLPYGSTPQEKRTKDILVTLHTAGRSFGFIAKQANEMGLKTRRGKLWTRGSVYQVVTGRGLK
jgi:DNA invertase Pin-like site-specific DNA recombinase